MTRIGRRGWLLAGALLASVGCAQVFGLNDYGPESTDAAADASVEMTPMPEASTDGTAVNDASSEARPAEASDGGSDAARVTDAGADGPYFAPDACTGTTACAPVAPQGWDGPFSFWSGSGTAPPCGTYYVPYFAGGTDLSAAPAQCSCSCSPPSGATCGSVSVQFGTGGCASACGSLTVAPGMCTGIQSATSGCGTGVGVTTSGSTASGGSCRPDASVVLPPAQWGMQAVACEPTTKSPSGCAAGEQCVPAPTTPFQGFCIVKPGSIACPSGPFTNSHVFYADFAEGRGCSPCTCGTATGVDCNAGAHVSTWSNATCGGSTGPVLAPLPVTCSSTTGFHSLEVNAAPDGGACAPDGGTPTGSASPQDLTTVCCTQ